MKFLEQFEKYNYMSLLQEDVAKAFQLDISYFLDEKNKKPEELCDIYISNQGEKCLFCCLVIKGIFIQCVMNGTIK